MVKDGKVVAAVAGVGVAAGLAYWWFKMGPGAVGVPPPPPRDDIRYPPAENGYPPDRPYDGGGSVTCPKGTLFNEATGQCEPVDMPPLQATIIGFSVEPKTLERGDSVHVEWETENAARVVLNGTDVAASGSMDVMVEQPTTFVLDVYNPDGGRQRRATPVSVVALPSKPSGPKYETLMQHSQRRQKMSSIDRFVWG